MFKKLSCIFTNVLHQYSATAQIIPEPVCSQKIQHDPSDLKLIQILKADIAAIEYLNGRNFVERERYFIKRRLKGIAKLQLKRASWCSENNWIIESRCLVRYLRTSSEKDAALAIEMLTPSSQKYSEARNSKNFSKKQTPR